MLMIDCEHLPTIHTLTVSSTSRCVSVTSEHDVITTAAVSTLTDRWMSRCLDQYTLACRYWPSVCDELALPHQSSSSSSSSHCQSHYLGFLYVYVCVIDNSNMTDNTQKQRRHKRTCTEMSGLSQILKSRDWENGPV